jgi:hypothetical protein
MKTNGGVFQAGMTQQKLNRAEIRASFQQMCGVRVSQCVGANMFAQASALRSRLAGVPHGLIASRLI